MHRTMSRQIYSIVREVTRRGGRRSYPQYKLVRSRERWFAGARSDGDLRPIDEFDVHRSTVDTASLCAWLKQAADRHDVLINGKPDYLDPNDPKYSPLFAAAVLARAAVDVKPEGMTVKKALARYLDKQETGLSTEARRLVAKVVNWQREGGAPRTRGGRKPVKP